MRKSISKLIVAGMALALALPVSAAKPVAKASATHATPTSSVAQKAMTHEKVAFQPKFTTRAEKKSTPFSTNVKVTRPNFKLDRPSRAPQYAAPLTEPMGAVVFSDAWTEYAYGIYSFPTSDASNEPTIVTLGDDFQITTGCVVGDKYYASYLYSFWGYILGNFHYVWDINTWELLEYESMSTEDLSNAGYAMTYDATTDKIYGQFFTADLSGLVFGIYDPATHTTTEIAPMDEQLNTIAADADGTLYAITAEGDLYTINKENGHMTFVGATGCYPAYLSSGCIDPKSGRFYWNVCPDDECGYMYEVNKATGEASLIYQLAGNEEICGMFIPAPLANDGAPAAATALSATFVDGALAGEVAFTAPTTLFDGTAFTGDFNYTLKANGEEIATGTVAAGAEVKKAYTAAEAGSYTFVVVLSNEAGESPKISTTIWIGPDQPVAPENVAMTYADGKFNITWDAVTAGVNEGFLGDITYTVTRYEDDKDAVVVAKGLTACEYSDAVDEPAAGLSVYYYTVAAVSNDVVSVATPSNLLALGAILPPYSVSFTDAASATGYTVVDGNGDGYTWTLTAQGMQVRWNSMDEMDDWFITPAVQLEAGKQYTIAVSAKSASSYYQERLEVLAGNAPTAEAMTEVVIEPTDVTETDAKLFKGILTATEAGKYYIGIHGISDADQYYLYVDGIQISAGVSTSAPAAPVVNVVPAADGSLSADVNVTAPTKSIAGDEISSIDKMIVYCGDEEIKTLTNVTPGETYTVKYDADENATYTFSAVAYNEYGNGAEGERGAFIGVTIAAAPADCNVVETATEGEVTVTWAPVSTTAAGDVMGSALITYTIANSDGEIIAEDLTDCTYTFMAVPEGQEFVYYGVYAVTEAGYSDPGVTNMIPAGAPFTLPYVESFANGSLSYPMGASSAGGATWNIGDNNTYNDLTDFDGNGGYAYSNGSALGASGELFTGKINLDVEAPALTFAYYCIAENDINELNIYVTTADGTKTQVANVLQNGGDEGSWVMEVVPLDAYAGQTVQITFESIVNYYTNTFIDNIQIGTLKAVDMQVVSINGPAKVKPNQDFSIDVKVLSMGQDALDSYTVELYRNGTLQAVKDGGAIATGESATFSFAQCLNVTAPEQNVYSVKVVANGDEDMSNNAVDLPVIVVLPNYPTATDLKATLANGGGVQLTWNEPELSTGDVKEAVTEDFESYEAFTYEDLGNWTLVDEDGGAIGGAQGINFPGIDIGSTACAYYVLNNESVSDYSNFDAHSGHQYLCSTFLYAGYEYVSDWLISPQLSGDAQTISLYAKSYSASYPETFKVLYSTTDTALDSFVEVEEFANISTDWTLYEFDVPAGATFFAIQCVSYDAFMFFVDDITYIPADGASMNLSIEGYNIYRNGVKINDAPVAETDFFDAEGTTGDIYVVTVAYTVGESGPCMAVAVGTPTQGIADMVAGNAEINVVDRSIVVTAGVGNVTVVATDGKVIYNEAANETNVVTVTPGTYVVKTGKLVKKVVVK